MRLMEELALRQSSPRGLGTKCTSMKMSQSQFSAILLTLCDAVSHKCIMLMKNFCCFSKSYDVHTMNTKKKKHEHTAVNRCRGAQPSQRERTSVSCTASTEQHQTSGHEQTPDKEVLEMGNGSTSST